MTRPSRRHAGHACRVAAAAGRASTVAAVALAAGCSVGGPGALPEGASALPFTVAESTTDADPEAPFAVMAGEAELRELWDGFEEAWTADGPVPGPVPPPTPDGVVAVAVSPDHRIHASEVVRVVEHDGAWRVELTGHDLGECAAPAVVTAEVHLLHVTADRPPSVVTQEVRVLPGCGLG